MRTSPPWEPEGVLAELPLVALQLVLQVVLRQALALETVFLPP